MLIVLQYPFADLRPFVAAGARRLAQPSWPFVQPGRDFVRQSGAVRRRRRGGLSPWSGEEFYSHAARAVRLREDLRARRLEGVAVFGHHGVSRRFHVFGPVARFEMAVRAQLPAGASPVRLLEELLTLRVGVPNEDGISETVRLGEAGARLARLYLRATTERCDGKRQPCESWWLEAGEPLCVLAFREEEAPAASLALRSHTPFACGPAKVSFAWVEHHQRLFGLWLVAAPDPDGDAARTLRLHLLRLHAERECLKRVLANLGTRLVFEAGTDPSDRLESYLDQALALLDKQQRFGLAQSPLLDAVCDSFSGAQPGADTALAAELTKARQSVVRKTQRFLAARVNQASVVNIVEGTLTIGRIDMRSINFGGNVSVTGDFNVAVADQIEGSFNRAASPGVPEELKAALQQLSIEVAKVAEQLRPAQAEAAARDLDSLVKEATAAEPRKKWYEVSAEGLLEAAKAVGETAAPLIEVVAKVLALLA